MVPNVLVIHELKKKLKNSEKKRKKTNEKLKRVFYFSGKIYFFGELL